MAESNRSTELSPAALERAGISIERDGWRQTVYTGTRDAMIAARLLSPEQVPGDPACPAIKVFRFERAGRSHTVSVFRYRTLVKLTVGPTHEELDAEQARDEARRVAEHARKEIASLPRSREAYERRVRALASVRYARDSLLEPTGGYSVAEGAWNEFEQAVDMALDGLLGGIIFDRAARDREIAARRQQAADADPEFARFMQATGASRG